MSNDNEWIPATNRYRISGTFRVRVYSDDLSDILGTVTEHECSHIVEVFDEESAQRAAVEQHYLMLDNSGIEYDTMGWKAQPTIEFMCVVIPAKRKQAQYSLFDMMEVM